MGRIKDLTATTTLSGSEFFVTDSTTTTAITTKNAAAALLQQCPMVWTGQYKNLGSSVTTAQHTAISNGTFEGIHLGDYWKIGSYTYRIAAFDYFYNCGDTSFATHHVVCVPDENMGDAQMNSTNTTDGGWAGSEMWTTKLATARSTIKSAFGDRLCTHRVYHINAVSNGLPSGGAWVDTDIDFMNEQMVYGSFIFGNGGITPTWKANYRIEKNQLPLFALDQKFINQRYIYWLKDVCSASAFAIVSYSGNANYYDASYSHGVRPAFCIS